MYTQQVYKELKMTKRDQLIATYNVLARALELDAYSSTKASLATLERDVMRLVGKLTLKLDAGSK